LNVSGLGAITPLQLPEYSLSYQCKKSWVEACKYSSEISNYKISFRNIGGKGDLNLSIRFNMCLYIGALTQLSKTKGTQSSGSLDG